MNSDSESGGVPVILSRPLQNAARAMLVGAMMVTAAWTWVRESEEMQPSATLAVESAPPDSQPKSLAGAEGSPTSFLVDLNQASRQELMLLPRIGRRTADLILADRTHHGPFGSINDLRRIPGIGPKTIQEISPYCRISDSRTFSSDNRLIAEH